MKKILFSCLISTICLILLSCTNTNTSYTVTEEPNLFEEWFEKKQISPALILEVLIPKKYRITYGLVGDELKKTKENNDKENDVRFIWYEIPCDANTESIEVFSQLNYGKTALTATELVKALLFQCDIYTTDKSLMHEIAFRRSCEWDIMEKQLQLGKHLLVKD